MKVFVVTAEDWPPDTAIALIVVVSERVSASVYCVLLAVGRAAVSGVVDGCATRAAHRHGSRLLKGSRTADGRCCHGRSLRAAARTRAGAAASTTTRTARRATALSARAAAARALLGAAAGVGGLRADGG